MWQCFDRTERKVGANTPIIRIRVKSFRGSSHSVSADRWPGELRLSNLEPRFICRACGKRGADVRPEFNWNKAPVDAMGYH
jgi:hypothetical protein